MYILMMITLCILGKDHRRTRIANAYFSLFMAVGNILGFAAGSYSGWPTIFPFTLTSACTINCANLKSAFLLHIALLAVTAYMGLSAQEPPTNLVPSDGIHEPSHTREPFLWELFGSMRYLSFPVRMILIVTALSWIGWFPFLLYDTDWMGRDIYKGKPGEGSNYHTGVRMGAVGLTINSFILGLTSLLMEKLCKKLGAGFVWGVSNILMSMCFVAMLIISFLAQKMDFTSYELPPNGLVIGSLIVFALLGVPLAVSYLFSTY